MNAPETLSEKFGSPRKHPMLRGSYVYNLDKKGRLVIPYEVRKALGSSLILVPAIQPAYPEGFWSLLLMGVEQWEAVEALPEANLEWWSVQGSMAHECEVADSTGRVLIPIFQRRLLELQPFEDVVIRGMGQAVQIVRYTHWQDEVWARKKFGDLAKPPHRRPAAISGVEW